MCLAVYPLTDGRLLKGRMLVTVAQGLGITFDQAHLMAEAGARAGLVAVAHGSSVSLTAAGLERGAILTPPTVRTSAGSRQPTKRPAPRAKRRARPR